MLPLCPWCPQQLGAGSLAEVCSQAKIAPAQALKDSFVEIHQNHGRIEQDFQSLTAAVTKIVPSSSTEWATILMDFDSMHEDVAESLKKGGVVFGNLMVAQAEFKVVKPGESRKILAKRCLRALSKKLRPWSPCLHRSCCSAVSVQFRQLIRSGSSSDVRSFAWSVGLVDDRASDLNQAAQARDGHSHIDQLIFC